MVRRPANCLYYAVSDVFPGVPGAEEIQRTVAEQFYRAGEVLGENYDYSYFDYGTMTPHVNHIPLQQDAAGGHGYVLYSAYRKFGDERYLEGGETGHPGAGQPEREPVLRDNCFRWVSIRRGG